MTVSSMETECDFTYVNAHGYYILTAAVVLAGYGVVNFEVIREAVTPVIAKLRYGIPGLDSTCENQVVWIWNELANTDGGLLHGRLKDIDEPVNLVRLTLANTPLSRVTYRGPA